MPRARTVLIAASLALAAPGSAAAAAPAEAAGGALVLRVAGAGAPERMLVCGSERPARVARVDGGARVRAFLGRHAGRPRALVLAIDRCSGGRWVRQSRARRAGATGPRSRLARALPDAAPGHYRVRVRAGDRRRRLFFVVEHEVVETRVSFSVRNVNRSKLACSADAADYRLSGRLTAPRSALATSGGPVTLLLHEFGYGRFFWTLPVSGYDFAHEMARRGHATVAVDRLGYDASDAPRGLDTCLGAQADMAHQVVQQLRAGSYSSDGGAPAVGFSRVALAGHSAGGQVAELAAASFGQVDALLLFAAADQGFKPRATQEAVEQGLVCTGGGQPSEKGAPGYAHFAQTPDEWRGFNFHDTEQTVLDAAVPLRNSDPCGDVASSPALLGVNGAEAGSISAPVLLLYGTSDAIYEQPAAGERQRELLSGSDDVTLRFFEDTGHALLLERSAPRIRGVASHWLAERGF